MYYPYAAKILHLTTGVTVDTTVPAKSVQFLAENVDVTAVRWRFTASTVQTGAGGATWFMEGSADGETWFSMPIENLTTSAAGGRVAEAIEPAFGRFMRMRIVPTGGASITGDVTLWCSHPFRLV